MNENYSGVRIKNIENGYIGMVWKGLNRSMDFYNRTTPKARKEYKCEYCNKPIHIGQIHSYETGKYDGDMFGRRLHFPCYKMMQTYCRNNREDEFTWDAVDDWLHDEYCYACDKYEDCGYGKMRSCPKNLKDFE